jgi:glycosyltransferase involved in cell wall biosynthesis
MEISVIIPTYNRAQTLPRALDSVLAQSLPADEILVIDDGSDDETRSLIESRYPQCRYIHQPNQGVSSARDLDASWGQGQRHDKTCKKRRLDLP